MHYFVISEANQAQVMIRLRPSHGIERLIREMKLFLPLNQGSQWTEKPVSEWSIHVCTEFP